MKASVLLAGLGALALLGSGASNDASAAGVAKVYKGKSVDVIVGSDVICEESDCLGVARMLDRFLTETGTGYFVLGSDANRYGVDKFSSIIASQGFDISSMDEAISGEDCSTFLRKNQNFNSRPHDKLEMFVVKRIS